MIEKDKEYWLNNPVFIKFKDRFDFSRMQRVRELKKVFVNERIIEIPFAIRGLSQLNERARVLDLGCSESLLPLYLSSLGFRVTGLDFRAFPYPAANFEFVRGDILSMPFEDGKFDAVTCVSTLEHLGLGFYADPKEEQATDGKAVQEISRVLKNNGRLILSVPYGKAFQGEHQRIYDDQRLTVLLKGYRIERKKYFAKAFVQGSRSNYWKETPGTEAGRIDSGGKTECVCCIEAVRS